jgi:hypothetical protein
LCHVLFTSLLASLCPPVCGGGFCTINEESILHFTFGLKIVLAQTRVLYQLQLQFVEGL